MARPSRIFARTLIFPMIVAAFAIMAQAQVWKGRFVKEGEVTVVYNPKVPIYKEPALSLRADWTIGGAAEQGEQALARPYSIAVDKDGFLYVLDIQDALVKVYDGSGRFVRRIGRRGQGPGEIGAAFSIMIPENSTILVVNDVGARRLVFFSLDGQFQKNLPMRGLSTNPVMDSRFNIYLDSADIRNRRESLRKMDPEMSTVLTEIFDQPADETHDPFKARVRYVVDAEDELVLGRAKSYEIDYYNDIGVLRRRILRDYDPLKVTQADIDEFLKRGAPPGLNPTYDFASRHACYRSFFVDDLGHLFVQTWERTVDNRQDIHDIFDVQGRFVGRVAMPRHEDLINPTVRILRRQKFYAIQPDDDGFDVVRRYSVTWSIPGEKPDKQ